MELYPDNINPLAGLPADQALATIVGYFQYIKERTQLAVNRLERYATEAGVSDLSVLASIDELKNMVLGMISALDSRVTSLSDAVGNLQGGKLDGPGDSTPQNSVPVSAAGGTAAWSHKIVTSIGSSSTDSQIPTAKAVQDAIAAAIH